MKRFSLSALLVLATTCVFSQSDKPLPTNDGFVLSWLCDHDYNDINSVKADGATSIITIALDGNHDVANRRYTAFNIDLALPFGMEAVTIDGKPDVALPEDFSIYAGRIGQLAHSIVGVARPGNIVRVACSSNANKELLLSEGDLFQVGVRIVSPYAKPGENKIFFSGQNLTTATKSQKYVPADTFRTIVVDEGMVSVPLTITTENKYSTCLLPFDATVPEGLRAYECVRIAGDSIIISKVENFSAYVPYILYAPNGYSGVLSGMTSATAYENRVNAEGVSVAGCLTGAVADQTISNGCVLRQTDSGMAFCPANGALYQVPAGKCWLNAGTSLSGSFVFAEESLAGISNHDVQGKSHAVYSLDGIRLPEMRKGINILNGKKIAY